MSLLGKTTFRSSIGPVAFTVATGTRWERSWDLGVIADSEPPANRRKPERLRWAFKRWQKRRQIAREIAAYRLQIAREGCTPAILEEAARRANAR